MADKNPRLQDYQDIQAQKYAKYKAQKDKEEKEQRDKEEKVRLEQEEKLRLVNEERLLRELQYREEYDSFLNHMETITVEIHNAISIIEIDMTLVAFMSTLENNVQFMYNDDLKQEIAGKVIQVVNSISQNENSKFDITVKDDNYEAAQRIAKNTKTILELVNYDGEGINIELMDTTNDEEIAKKWDDTNKTNNDTFFGKGHKLCDYDTVNIINDEQKPKVNKENKKNQENKEIEFIDDDEFPDFVDDDLVDFPQTNNLTYYSGADNIDDPDVVQMLHYQNELLDTTGGDEEIAKKLNEENNKVNNKVLDDNIDDPDMVQMLHYQNELLDDN